MLFLVMIDSPFRRAAGGLRQRSLPRRTSSIVRSAPEGLRFPISSVPGYSVSAPPELRRKAARTIGHFMQERICPGNASASNRLPSVFATVSQMSLAITFRDARTAPDRCVTDRAVIREMQRHP